MKLIGLFYKNPYDLVYLPVLILFRYFYSLIKLYTLITLYNIQLECTPAVILIMKVTNKKVDILR